ncbi:MAG TPA: hypothetical protein VH092_34575, partial [Urbifossiella sp.]|nr:hypothetical protein [Urbifossiella sp.]
MKRFLIVLGAVAAGLVMLAFIGLAARFVRDRNQRATEEEIRAEREADRAAARAAFAAPIAPTAAEAEEFGRFFQSLGEALDRGNEATVVDHFDADRMTSEFIRFGAFDRLGGRPSARDRAGMARGVRQGIGRTLVQNELLRWDSTQVRAVRWAADRREAVVIATHKNEVGGEETDAKVRWWLVRGPGAGWKAYDLEDLDVGSRLTQLGAAVVTPELVAEGAAGIARIQTATEATREALGAVLRRDADAADRALARARGQNLPIPVAALRELAEASLALVRLDHATTLTRLDEADRLLPGMPAVKLVRAAALNLAGRHEEALEQARGYLDELGPDALAYTHTGLALERLNRPDEAAADYRKALDTTPNQLDALFGLRRVLPADKKAEIGDRLANARDPLRDFDELIRDARDDGDAAGVTALLAGLRKARPDDPRVAEEEVRELVKGGRYAAAALVQRRLGNSPPGRTMPPVLTAYLGAMLGANRAAEAWGGG